MEATPVRHPRPIGSAGRLGRRYVTTLKITGEERRLLIRRTRRLRRTQADVIRRGLEKELIAERKHELRQLTVEAEGDGRFPAPAAT